MRVWIAALLALAIAFSLGACAGTTEGRGAVTSGSTGAPTATLGPRTQTSGCHVKGLLPDRACTPGSIFTAATVGQICRSGYSRSVRDVPESLKRRVYAEYGIRSHIPYSYEVDHLVSLELGGSNSIANLWPEVTPGYHEKDKIENRLHDAVCAHEVSLRTAQRQMARDWRRTAVGRP